MHPARNNTTHVRIGKAPQGGGQGEPDAAPRGRLKMAKSPRQESIDLSSFSS
jgi:hypothetical protein